MKPSILYRIASILIFIFAAGHTIGFRRSDPKWGIDSLVTSLRAIHFQTQGFTRTYWDFFTGFGLFASLFLVFSGVLAWQLGGVPPAAWGIVRGPAWALAICFVFVTILNWRYFFLAPVIFAGVISGFLIAAAWLSSKP
jgi:hypothetical protein